MTTPEISAELKALKSRIQAGLVELEHADEAIQAANKAWEEKNRAVCGLQGRLRDLQAKIDQAATSKGDLIVSEHALLRWIERAYKLDLDAVRADMVSPQMRSLAKTTKSFAYRSEHGVKLVVKDGTIVSVVPL